MSNTGFLKNMNFTVEQIYTEFHSKLLGFIRSRVSDPSVAEDLLQDVYLKIHSKIGDVKDSERLESWIYQVTRNTIIDYYRRARPQAELSEQYSIPDIEDADPGSELAGSIKGMLACLDDKDREALEFTEFQGNSQIALAEKLNISVSGAKSRVQRAREKLKDAFLDCCHLEFDRRGGVVDYDPKCARCGTAPINSLEDSTHSNCC